jgi:hypothetical protein
MRWAFEFRLLLAERSLVVVGMPLAVLSFYPGSGLLQHSPGTSLNPLLMTANTAKLLLLFLIGLAVFYTGEAMHAIREVKIEPVICSTPCLKQLLLLSKYHATIVLRSHCWL